MFFAAIIYGLQLLLESIQSLVGDSHVIASVIADLESISMELRDLLPRHVVLFVGREIPAFRDEKSCAKSVLKQDRSHDREMCLCRIVKRQDDNSIRT